MRTFELSTRMQSIKRSKGRSATAAAAYRSGEKIECEREGQTHDYTRKQGVLATGLILPENSPTMTRSELWNAAELKENRKNSQTARDYMFSLPDELSSEGRQRAVEKVAALVVDRHGVAVDYAIHAPSRGGDERNYHCHLMMTTRRMEHGKLTEKTRELDKIETSRDLVKQLRKDVANILNRELHHERGRADGRTMKLSYNFGYQSGHETTGQTVHVEHRSFEDRGIDRAPQQHKGVVLTHTERRGHDTANMRHVAYAKRQDLREHHSTQIAKQKIRHQMELAQHRSKWAKEGRERVDNIKSNLEKAERADTPLKGLKRFKAFLLRRTAKENDARLARSRDRHDLAGREIEGLRQHYKQQRVNMTQDQEKERDSLAIRQGKDRKQMEGSLKEQKRLMDIKRETGRDLVKEQRDRVANRPQGIGRSLTP